MLILSFKDRLILSPTSCRPASWIGVCAWLCIAAILAVLPSQAAGQASPAAEQIDTLEQYLQRLGLGELRAHLLEQKLSDETNSMATRVIAQRLADVYAGQLVTATDDTAKFAAIMERIEALIKEVPQARTPLLEVMLLQADYYRAEKLITRWLANQAETGPRSDAADILQQIAPRLNKRQAELATDVEQRIEKIEFLEPGDVLDRAQQELRPIQAVAGRAMYFAATSNYYLNLLSATADVDADADGFRIARRLYRKLLGIESEYTDYNASLLGLTSIWRARSLIGLALSEAALGNQPGSRQCFEWLQDSSVASAVREQVPYWRLRALASSGQFSELLRYAQQEVAAFASSGSPDKVSFCVGLVRMGLGASVTSPELEAIGMLGIVGLVKLRQTAAAGHLIEEYEIEIGADTGFFLNWIKGQQLFQRAESSREPGDYELAATALALAVSSDDTTSDLNAASHCRAQLAWCNFRLQRVERAARLFEEAAEGLKATDDPAAARYAWNAFLSYQRLSKRERHFVSSAINQLNQIQRDFPASSYAKNAEYHIGKLQGDALSPAELLKKLSSVGPDSDNYLAARFDICTTWFQQWKQRTGDEKREAAAALLVSTDAYLDAARRLQMPGRKVTVCLRAVQVAEQSKPPNLEVARRFLAQAQSFAGQLPTSDRKVAEYHYRAMRFAQQTRDSAERDRHASWIVANSQGSPYELNALILVVKDSEQALQSAAPGDRVALAASVYRHWRRLVELLGSTPDRIRTSKNARIVNSKLAQYAAARGSHAEAARALTNLLAVDPKNRDFLRRAGDAEFNAGNYEAALRHWQVLLAGVERSSEAWYEAKYFQLSCLRRLDGQRFQRAAEQFRLLHPQLGPAKWSDRFAELLPK